MTEEEGGEGNLGMIALRDNRCMAFSRKGVVLTQRSSLWCSQMKHFFIFTKAQLTHQCPVGDIVCILLSQQGHIMEPI